MVGVRTLPGLVDVHVHLRVPGGTHKESAASGTSAALAGGMAAVLAMPNTDPPVASAAALKEARRAILADALCDVGQFVGATDGNAEGLAAAHEAACGLKIYVNDTFGQLRVERLTPLARHFGAWPRGRPLVVHAEGPMVAAAIGLAAVHARGVHIAHVSRRSEIELIRSAKEAGLPVTCEVTPHHLLLEAGDSAALGGFGAVRPRLASADDRRALWSNLDVVDCVATDHAPHTRGEKSGSDPPPGFPGLETALVLMLSEVAAERLSLERVVELMSTTPGRLFGVSTPEVSSVEVEMGPARRLPERGYLTKADWSPFAGRTVRARVLSTTLRGCVAFADGRVAARPEVRWLAPASLRDREGVA